MATRNVRRTFTEAEYKRLRDLTKEKENADSTAQKGIRAKMRRIGFFWDEVGEGKFTLPNFDALFTSGKLTIIGKSTLAQVANKEASPVTKPTSPIKAIGLKSRANSDEAYVIDLCDEVLNQKALRQHHFDFLRGDKGHLLPVDAYYPQLNLVVEYYERQHTESVEFFDEKQTVSGVSRGEQRRIYDQRRAEVLPQHGIKLVIISYSDFGESKKLKRNHDKDINVVRKILK